VTTSGSTDFSLTGTQMVTQALYLLNVTPKGETPATADLNFALTSLETMIKTWGTVGRLWLKTETTQALTASTASYAMASGARKVLDVRRRDTSSIDTPLFELSRQEYYDLPNKTGTGTPVNWYHDYQVATRTLYVWPAPDTSAASNLTLYITYARVIEDVDSLSNTLDLPQEWGETLIHNVAKNIGPSYGLAGDPNYAKIEARADALYGALASLDQESASVTFSPDHRG
jgi:hypothetical protein